MANWRNGVLALAFLMVVVLVPVLLQETQVGDDPDAEQLVIVSPHNESIRYEFEHAFARHCRQRLGQTVDIDWRTPGGTSEIVRYLRSEFVASFRQGWLTAGESWAPAVAGAVLDRKLVQGEAPAAAWRARQAFLAGNTGIGVDLFFGGGQYDHGRLAEEGILVPCGVQARHPEWFRGPDPVLIQSIGGEVWYDKADRYYGACLSSFGICFSLERWQELGLGAGPDAWPQAWDALGDPRLLGQVGVADPSKSGSIAKCFEMLIQQKMGQVMAAAEQRAGGGLSAAAKAEALSRGWYEALLLVRRIGANARYFTASAGKVPVDVSQGSAAAGMCIDFYGRSQAEWTRNGLGREVMAYTSPRGGSSVSADPIALLRGAPHPQTAKLFIDFVLSPEGQRLWNYRPGEAGGPVQYSLRRLPIRRDAYSEADRARMSDGTEQPFELASSFQYHPEWTGRLFGLIRVLVRVMIIDCHEELRQAWAAVAAAGGPEAVPAAVAQLGELPFTYAQAGDMAKRLGNRPDCLQLPREWLEFFRDSYARAAVLARAQGPARAGLATDSGGSGRSRDLLQVTRTQATSGGT